MPVLPTIAGELKRAQARSELGPPPEGRPVQPLTGSTRDKYLKIFRDWFWNEGIDLDSLLVEEINILLLPFWQQSIW